MSLQQLDELFKILKDERVAELLEENKRLRKENDELRANKIYGIYDRCFPGDVKPCFIVECNKNNLEKVIEQTIAEYLYQLGNREFINFIYLNKASFVIAIISENEQYGFRFKQIEFGQQSLLYYKKIFLVIYDNIDINRRC